MEDRLELRDRVAATGRVVELHRHHIHRDAVLNLLDRQRQSVRAQRRAEPATARQRRPRQQHRARTVGAIVVQQRPGRGHLVRRLIVRAAGIRRRIDRRRRFVIQQHRRLRAHDRRGVIVHRHGQTAFVRRAVRIHDRVTKREIDVVLVIACRMFKRLEQLERVSLGRRVERQLEDIRLRGAARGGKADDRGSIDHRVAHKRFVGARDDCR